MSLKSITDILRDTTAQFKGADHIITPQLDARWLVAHVYNLSDADLIAGVTEHDPAPLVPLIARRMAGEPLAKIMGHKQFYGRDFIVSTAVLDPRPDSETLITAALQLSPPPARILELGVGSGCLILTLLAHWPDSTGIGVDCSLPALKIAQQNAARLQLAARIGFVYSEWCAGVQGEYDLIISNPPYIATATIPHLDIGVRDYDPHLALDGGADGLYAYRQILQAAPRFLAQGGKILLEIGENQAESVTHIALSHGLKSGETHNDLGGHIRVLTFFA